MNQFEQEITESIDEAVVFKNAAPIECRCRIRGPGKRSGRGRGGGGRAAPPGELRRKNAGNRRSAGNGEKRRENWSSWILSGGKMLVLSSSAIHRGAVTRERATIIISLGFPKRRRDNRPHSKSLLRDAAVNPPHTRAGI